MAYKDLEAITEHITSIDYTEIFLKLQEKNMSFSQLKEQLSLSDDSFQKIKEKKPLSYREEEKIKSYLEIKDSLYKTEYFFSYPTTLEGLADKQKALLLYEKLKAHNFTILVDQRIGKENKYKLIGNVNGTYYEQEVELSYDTSAIIVFASYVEEALN